MAEVLNSPGVTATAPPPTISQPVYTATHSPPPFVEEKQESSNTINNILLTHVSDQSESETLVSGQDSTSYGVVKQEGVHDNAEAEVLVGCSTKCPAQIVGVGVSDETAIVVPCVVAADGVSDNEDCNVSKREKRQKRRGGKARKKREAALLLNCYFGAEVKREKGLTYSREEMLGLRFEDLEGQKRKWAEVYCGLGSVVAKEYDGLERGVGVISEHVVHFDPRPQFQKALKRGEEGCQLSENHLENPNTLDTASCHASNDELGSTVVEGEYSEDDDSDEDYSSIQKPAFMVTGEPDFDSGPPQDGLEYLRRVRWETAQIPKVKIGRVEKTKEQTPYMPQIPEIPECSENLLPLKEWEDSFLADFSELRQGFSQLESQDSSAKEALGLQPLHQEDNLHQILESIVFKNFESKTSIENSCELEATSGTTDQHSPGTPSIVTDYPTLSTILKMEPAARNSRLKKRITSVQESDQISRNDCLWLFALCATVDSPLDADACAALRSLLRKCASLRAAKTTVDDEVVMLNILATISGRYFGQSEK